MAIEIRETIRRYRYLGIELPAPPGMTHEQVRDLHSTLYPELISADIEVGELIGGVREVTFKRAVGTKGARRRRLCAALAELERGIEPAQAVLAAASTEEEVEKCSSIWERCARSGQGGKTSMAMRPVPEWRALPPVA